MKLALLVLAGLVLEILVWIGVGDLVGSMWYVFFWFIAAFVIGLNLIRKYAGGLTGQIQQAQMGMMMGGDPALTANLPKILAGFFLLLPGLMSDVLAVLMLIPAVQNALKAAMMKMMLGRQEAMMKQMMGNMGAGQGGDANPFADLMRQMQDMQNQQHGRDSSIIDGEAREVMPEAKRLDLKDVKKN